MLIRTLEAWLAANWRSPERTDAHFAEKVGCSGSHLSLILKGKAKPSLALAVKIEEQTAGAITPTMLFEFAMGVDAGAVRASA